MHAKSLNSLGIIPEDNYPFMVKAIEGYTLSNENPFQDKSSKWS